MKVLLLPPVYRYALEYPSFLSLSDFPSGFAYIASALKQAGHTVIGGNFNNIVGYVDAPTMLKAELTKKIKETNPELIGLGGLCTDYKFLKDAIGIIRETTKAPIVLGGQIVNQDAEDVFKLLKPDWAVVGDGERAIVEIADGVAQSKGIIDSGTNPNIDSVAFPDYEPFGVRDMMDNYGMATRLLYRYTRTNPRLYNIVTARHCPFACSFCTKHQVYQERSIENIMAEIKEAYEKYQFNILLILDELFVVNKQRMRDFCVAVLQGKLQYGWDFDWMFQTHASAKLDYDHLCLAKEAGCVSFSYGLESASPTVLKSMNKKIEPEQVAEAIDLAKQTGIGFSANLIFGDPAETMETIAESLSFWLKHSQDSCIFLSNVSPYPGSQLFAECQKKGLFLDKAAYYENIDKNPVNLTAIHDREYAGHTQLIKFLEQSWLFCQTTPIKILTRLEKRDKYLDYASGDYYKIETTCPHCEKDIEYVERLGDVSQAFWMGTNCQKCNRKIKIVK